MALVAHETREASQTWSTRELNYADELRIVTLPSYANEFIFIILVGTHIRWIKWHSAS